MKNVKTLGKELSKNQQKEIAGGTTDAYNCGPKPVDNVFRRPCPEPGTFAFKCIGTIWVATCDGTPN